MTYKSVKKSLFCREDQKKICKKFLQANSTKRTIFQQKNNFTIRKKKKKKIDKKAYYYLKNEEKKQYLPKRFQRTELFALINNFAV